MREFIELRIKEEHAPRVFNENEGKRLGSSVRSVRLRTDDPRLPLIDDEQRRLRTLGDFFYAGWSITREYSTTELQAAQFLQLRFTTSFEPAGEESGTVYDDSSSCSVCGAGRRQISPLRLDLRKVPENRDFARTISEEWIVSQRAAEALLEARVKGVIVNPVHHKATREADPVDLQSVPTGIGLLRAAREEGIEPGTWEFQVWINAAARVQEYRRAAREQRLANERSEGVSETGLPRWYQLIPSDVTLDIAPETRIGIDPFDVDREHKYVCPRGHTLGLNLLSELWIQSPVPKSVDFAATRQCIGVRRGLLVPSPLLVISQRLFTVLKEARLRGWDAEVVHVSPAE